MEKMWFDTSWWRRLIVPTTKKTKNREFKKQPKRSQNKKKLENEHKVSSTIPISRSEKFYTKK